MVHGRWGKPFAILFVSLMTLVGAQAFEDAQSVPGEFVITVEDQYYHQSKEALSEMLRSEVVRKISPASRALLVRRPTIEDVRYAINSLQEHSFVKIAEPNYIYHVDKIPNDPYLKELWGLINNGGRGTVGVDVGTQKAWDIHTGSKRLVVAVIDTGVDYNIRDLAPNMWVNQTEAQGKPGVDDDGNGYVDDFYGWDFANNDSNPVDDHGHGSHCSGTIGAKGNDGHGVVGVNWDVRIMALKFIKAKGGGSLDGAIAAIDYAVKNGANVLSNSWGGGGYTKQLEQAIIRAKDANVLFVAAAGNSRSDNDRRPVYPANYKVDNVISVAAVNSRGKLARFSNYGKRTVHLAAPGVKIVSTTPRGLASMDGTSMAAPHVSGVAALLWSHQPQLTMAQVRHRLLTTTKPLVGLTNKVATGGMVNAYLALTNASAPVDPNDPTRWSKIKKVLSTKHPYDREKILRWKIELKGVNKISLHFSKFETEKNFDYLLVKDKTGKVVSTLSGKLGEVYSNPVQGNVAYLEFHSDKTKVGYGFDLIDIAYK